MSWQPSTQDPKWNSLRNQRGREHNMVANTSTAVLGDTTYLRPGQLYYDLRSMNIKPVRDNICKKATLCTYAGELIWVSCDDCSGRSYLGCITCNRQ